MYAMTPEELMRDPDDDFDDAVDDVALNSGSTDAREAAVPPLNPENP